MMTRERTSYRHLAARLARPIQLPNLPIRWPPVDPGDRVRLRDALCVGISPGCGALCCQCLGRYGPCECVCVCVHVCAGKIRLSVMRQVWTGPLSRLLAFCGRAHTHTHSRTLERPAREELAEAHLQVRFDVWSGSVTQEFFWGASSLLNLLVWIISIQPPMAMNRVCIHPVVSSRLSSGRVRFHPPHEQRSVSVFQRNPFDLATSPCCSFFGHGSFD